MTEATLHTLNTNRVAQYPQKVSDIHFACKLITHTHHFACIIIPPLSSQALMEMTSIENQSTAHTVAAR
jgi:hypothetical protein